MAQFDNVKALLFDVFGTVVDWRNSIIVQLEAFGKQHGFKRDWTQFADQWRALYQPSMEEVRSGERPWINLDALHRESLLTLLGQFDISGLSEAEITDLNHAWHRLRPWPDSVEGLTRLKKRFIIAPQSNGNIALIVNMAKFSKLPWDVVLGAETARAYKPLPDSYCNNIALLGLKPSQCMMVAAHNDDLKAASALGLKTAFILRPSEYGPKQTTDLHPEGDWTIKTDSLKGLADILEMPS